jgi:hypothetical protein
MAFNSTSPIAFDTRQGSLSGPIVFSSSDSLSSTNSSWSRNPSGPALIPGVNYPLNGSNTDNDFFMGCVDESDPPNGVRHVVNTPEPGTWIAWVLVGVTAPVYARWRRRRA